MAQFIFFRFLSLFLFSVAMAMQKKNALAIEKILNSAYIRFQSLSSLMFIFKSTNNILIIHIRKNVKKN